MAANPLKNVSLKDCRKFLVKSGCKNYRTTGDMNIGQKRI